MKIRTCDMLVTLAIHEDQLAVNIITTQALLPPRCEVLEFEHIPVECAFWIDRLKG